MDSSYSLVLKPLFSFVWGQKKGSGETLICLLISIEKQQKITNKGKNDVRKVISLE